MKSNEISLKCICCNKKLEYIYEGDYEPEDDMWSGAVVHSIVAGYGSCHDMHKFVIGICDDCVSKKLDDKSIISKGSCWKDYFDEGISI